MHPLAEFRRPPPDASVGRKLGAMAEWMKSLKSIKQLDAIIARTTPEELSRQVEKLNELYRGLLGAADAPYLERIRKANERPKSLDTLDVHTRVTSGLLSDYTPFTRALSRAKATIRVAEGLIVVRRWQLRHGRDDSPPSLDAAAKEAGLPSPAGRPLRRPADPPCGRQRPADRLRHRPGRPRRRRPDRQRRDARFGRRAPAAAGVVRKGWPEITMAGGIRT